MGQQLATLIRDLFSRLELVSQEHPELTDTETREAVFETLNCYFVWERISEPPPKNYRMYSADGNQGVQQAISRFIAKGLVAAKKEGVAVGQPRLDALQDKSIRTPNGETYILFMGHSYQLQDCDMSSDLLDPGVPTEGDDR